MNLKEYFVKINKNRLDVLNIISANSPNGINQARICLSLTLSTSTIDRITKDLYLMDLIESKPKDNRITLYFITKKGSKIWDAITELEGLL